ncbi:unnamed protein product [Ilex paraguariensis]|uniref:Uncharacterized protein n=1 Tax=Ilex paraguariensis TaxID=185542 RepID=A0ABC8SHU5_9AQUA
MVSWFQVLLAQQFGTLTLLVLSSTATGAGAGAGATMAMAMANPNCADRCGDVPIPYPFGMTEDCYLNKDFLITCNSSFNPPKAFLGTTNLNVTEISLQGQLKLLQFVASQCYDQKENKLSDIRTWFELLPFTISTENKLTVIGCNTQASIDFYHNNASQQQQLPYATTGCISKCENISSFADGSCSGVGCCQASIPKGVWNISVTLQSYDNYTKSSNSNSCSYAFVTSQDEFKFTPKYLRQLQNTDEFPLVAEWTVGNETCDVAQKNLPTYACKQNTKCYEPDIGSGGGGGLSGYRCNCSEEYQGNPYLTNGCQGISTDTHLLFAVLHCMAMK